MSGDTAKQLIHAIVHGMEEIKAEDIVVMDLRKVGHSVTDYFIICHGNTGIQAKSIAESVERQTIQLADEAPSHIEGLRNAKWILMDYGNVVVHIFDREARSYYDIEELWGDAEISRVLHKENK